jgi:CBS domain-containing protein
MLSLMEEIARFLGRHPPFDRLPAELLAQTAARVEIEFFPRGACILRQGGEPSRFLYLIVKGTVELRQAGGDGSSELVETLNVGEAFGQLSLLSGTPHLWDAVAGEDVLAYLIPADQVERLQQQPGFEALLARRAGDRLRHAVVASAAGAPLDLLSVQASALSTRPLVTCAPDDTVVQAARQMRDQRVSSLIVEGRPPGLVTATDLRDRVLAAGLDPDTPVRQVMTTPLHTMPTEASLGELLLAMVDRGVHHLPLTRDGRVVGMVTDTDMLRHQSSHPLLIRRQLERATGPEGLAGYAREVTTAAARMVRAGSPAGDVTRFVASAHDALYVRAVRDAEVALGPPPCPYALLVLGSGARREPTLRTDQDHAIVLADDPPPAADAWFAALAERVAATLEGCGLPRCPGDVLATNPARRVPLGAWQDQFARWMEQPEEEALLEAGHLLRLPPTPRRSGGRAAAAAGHRLGGGQPAVPGPPGRGRPAPATTPRVSASPARRTTGPDQPQVARDRPDRRPGQAAGPGGRQPGDGNRRPAAGGGRPRRGRDGGRRPGCRVRVPTTGPPAAPGRPPGRRRGTRRRRGPGRTDRAAAPLAQGRHAPAPQLPGSVRIRFRTDQIG